VALEVLIGQKQPQISTLLKLLLLMRLLLMHLLLMHRLLMRLLLMHLLPMQPRMEPHQRNSQQLEVSEEQVRAFTNLNSQVY
jgi:hypothetical protein